MTTASADERASASGAAVSSALQAWRARLTAAGVACRLAAFYSEDAGWCAPFPEQESTLQSAWQSLRTRVSATQPVALSRVDGAGRQELLMATALQMPTGQDGIVGILLAPPHDERVIQLVMLSLGWLQMSLSVASLVHSQRAAQLLELLGYVGSQLNARAAAQEWINRTAAWCRREMERVGGEPAALSLMLFDVRNGTPSWWVSSDTAIVEKGSPLVNDASEVAARAAAESNEVEARSWWALPLLDKGEVCSVLVARLPDAQPLAPDFAALLRASADLTHPLLQQWRAAERGLFIHALHAVRSLWRRFTAPGHLAWKATGAAIGAVLAALLLIPVDDRVTAPAVIEGRIRQVVTAPFEGFIAAAPARPGAIVQRGDTLARLDDRDLKLEQHKRASEREQAGGKLRQAMAERDAPAVALAAAELRQAEAELALVEAKLARAALTAPIDGVVVTGDWAQQIGAPIEVGKEMFEVASSDGYRVVLHVADSDITRLRAGQKGVLRLAAQPQTAYPFRISRVTATASVQEGVNGFRVEAAWEGETPHLSPGMQGVGKVETGRANLLTVWTRSSIDWLLLKLWSWGW
jgi:multidrug resistance efflux pump